jgi:Holliday junction resolvasome RuvABC endonuclease subunit
MRILALDPGVVTGHALLDIEGKALHVFDYGVVPIPSGKHALVALWEWLQWYTADVRRPECAVFEELLDTKGRVPDHCPREAKEARGVLRLFLESRGIVYTSYHPSTVKSVFGVRKKIEIRQRVSGMVGLKLKGYPDHVSDALAVGIVYASRELGWTPPSVEAAPTEPRRKARKADAFASIDFSDPANKDKLVEAMEAGVLRARRGR